MALGRTQRPVWQAERCLPCGACTRRCPASTFPELIQEPESLRGRVARQMPFPSGNERPSVPACQAACPLGQDVPGYLRAAAAGDFAAAAAIIYRANPLPSVCGRLCLRACMRACTRAHLDAGVDIRAVKAAAVELAGQRPTRPPATERDGEVVVVGAGPAGLASAFFLRRIGWRVRLLEAEPEPGGLLRWAVPDFDLPRAALSADVDAILATGVELETGRRIGSKTEISALIHGGARAVVLATGAGRGQPLGIPGEQSCGCTDAVRFARRFAEDPSAKLRGPVVVAGAGTMAVAAARLAIRAGAGPVHLVSGRLRDAMPADPDQLARAEQDGVQILDGLRPVEALGANQLSAVRLSPVIYGMPDGVGRRWPLHTTGEQAVRELEAGTLVAATDRLPDLGLLGDDRAGLVGPGGLLAVDGKTYQTVLPGVFAAGDAMTGARNGVEAVAIAMRVAVAVDRAAREGAA